MTAHATLRNTTGRVAGGASSGLATVLVAALIAATVAAASASPTRSGDGAGSVSQPGHLVDVVCFTIPHQWSVALDGPLPRCSRTVR